MPLTPLIRYSPPVRTLSRFHVLANIRARISGAGVSSISGAWRPSGRKSVRQIAGLVDDDGTEQALQQFDNRVRGTGSLCGAILPVRRVIPAGLSWVVTDFALPKTATSVE